MSSHIRSHSLYDLVASVRRCIEATYTERYWVRAETTSLSINRSSGHCYLELEEKEPGQGVRARIRASIWRNTVEQINRKFATAQLPPLASGMNILCLVQVTYHELYGMSLVIHDIDTSYSLGEIARQRQETIARLRREGVYDHNKLQLLRLPTQRLAIITSPTAAGYEDFMHQLHHNNLGLKFYTSLYKAQMQGEGTTASIIAALDRLALHAEYYDAVVIIRGGGSVSDLRAFDDYQLAYFCTQYPLPIITGIGHDRDVSVLDMVAHTSLKTPTAVAEYLIQRLGESLQATQELSLRLSTAAYLLQTERQRHLSELSLRLPQLASRSIHKAERRQTQLQEYITSIARRSLELSKQKLGAARALLPHLIRHQLNQREQAIRRSTEQLTSLCHQRRQQYEHQLQQYEQVIRLAHPDNILRRGFALVERQGKLLTTHSTIAPGDELRIRLGRQSIEARVKQVSN